MNKFRNKYRVESARLNVWDYSNLWWYYVTINTREHIEYFGEVVNEKMELNELGRIVNDEWLKTKLIRKNVELDYYVIMPNHIHGIIILTEKERKDGPVGRLQNKSAEEKLSDETMHRIVFTPSLNANSLGSIVGQFKSVCTKKIKSAGLERFLLAIKIL